MKESFKVTVTTQPPTTASYLRAFYGADPNRLGDFCVDFINNVLQDANPIGVKEQQQKVAAEKARKKAMLELEKFKLELAIKELE